MPYKVVVPLVVGRNEVAVDILKANGCDVQRLPAPAAGQPLAVLI
ncbi:MAG TPA: hypothetical protein VJB57_02670 [Dehalococcoidia bacterium]|nr:hypothetical protein [Dehalococcoidia bacterium]